MTAGTGSTRWKLAATGTVFLIGSALETGLMVVLWFLVGLFSHDVPSGDRWRSARRATGGPDRDR